jgi:hypothetical protein
MRFTIVDGNFRPQTEIDDHGIVFRDLLLNLIQKPVELGPILSGAWNASIVSSPD